MFLKSQSTHNRGQDTRVNRTGSRDTHETDTRTSQTNLKTPGCSQPEVSGVVGV